MHAGASESNNPGFDLDVDGLTVAVGASHTTVEGQASGSVDLIRWDGSTWLHETRLTVEDAEQDPGLDGFGGFVDLDGNRLVVGAALSNSEDDEFAGKVHLFEKRDGTWSHAQSFMSPHPTEIGLFGADVALSGDRLFIAESPAKATAQVHLYELNARGTWSLTESFEHTQNPGLHRIDRVVADGDTVAFIGEPDTGITPNGVSIWTWDGSGWQAETATVPGDARPRSLDLDGDRLVVGVPSRNCAHTYRREADGSWSGASPDLMTCVDPNQPTEHPTAGYAVATAGTKIAVGAYAANESDGEVLAFDVDDGANRRAQLPGGMKDGRSGYTLAMNDSLLVVGRGVLGGSGDTVVATVQPTATLFD